MAKLDIELTTIAGEYYPDTAWTVMDRQVKPCASETWKDACLYKLEFTSDYPLSLVDIRAIHGVIATQIWFADGDTLATKDYYKVHSNQHHYRLYHAAHASPINWAGMATWIATNWRALLIAAGIVAVAILIVTFLIKTELIIWKAGSKIEEFIEGSSPGQVTAMAGGGAILLLVIIGLIASKRG